MSNVKTYQVLQIVLGIPERSCYFNYRHPDSKGKEVAHQYQHISRI